MVVIVVHYCSHLKNMMQSNVMDIGNAEHFVDDVVTVGHVGHPVDSDVVADGNGVDTEFHLILLLHYGCFLNSPLHYLISEINFVMMNIEVYYSFRIRYKKWLNSNISGR